jgi:hypothetical protein
MTIRTGVLLLVLAATAHAADSTGQEKMISIDPRTVEFATIPGIPDCATYATLRGNPRTGPAWVLLKLATGCKVPPHWHTPNEDMLVIRGSGAIVMRDGPTLQLAPGAYTYLPSHHVHQATCTRECLFFNSADGPFDIHYVDRAGKDISLDEAVKELARTKAPPKKRRR